MSRNRVCYWLPSEKTIDPLSGDFCFSLKTCNMTDMSILFWKKNNNHISLGSRGEAAAVRYLEKDGYKIIDRNFKNKVGRAVGEIDIVAQKRGALFFVEVKTRSRRGYIAQSPEENISRLKLLKMERIISRYLQEKNFQDREYHFDCIAVEFEEEKGTFSIKHIPDMFI